MIARSRSTSDRVRAEAFSSESEIQRSAIRLLRAVGFRVRRVNAGRTGAARAAEAGAPDLEILNLGGGRVGFIELKVPGGKLSASQVLWHAAAKNDEMLVAVAHSPQEALRIAEGWRDRKCTGYPQVIP